MTRKRLAIVTSHPIQYNAPWFRLLAESPSIQPLIFYTWEQAAAGAKYDPDFKKHIEWDIPLLEGYEYRFVKNESSDPGTHHYKGLVNPTLNAEIAAWRPDAVLVFGWSWHSHLKCLRHFHGKVPVLFRGDSTLLDEQPGIRRLVRRLFLRWIYGHVDHALYVGTRNKEYFLVHGLGERQLVFAPHAIDNSRFGEPDDRYGEQAREWRGRLGIKDADVVVLFAGKLEPNKNPFFLLEIAKRCPDPRLKIIIAGTGVLEAALRDAAATDPRIRFIGFQNQLQMPVVYRLGDIYILPSRGPGETWGLGVNEAMACGCAIMMSDKAGGAPDLVGEGGNGIRFEPGNDVLKCCEWVEGMLRDRRLIDDMKRESRRRIAAFQFRKIVGALERPDLYN